MESWIEAAVPTAMRTSRPIARPASATGPRTISGRRSPRAQQDARTPVSSDALSLLHVALARGERRDVRLPADASGRRERAARERDSISGQHAIADGDLECALFPR